MSQDGSPPLPAPVDRALDAFEHNGWKIDWRERTPIVIDVWAKRGRWIAHTAFRRPPLDSGRGGWKAGNVSIRERNGRRIRRVNRRLIPMVAAATDEQIGALLGGAEPSLVL